MTDKQIYQIGLTMINGVGDILARHLLEALGDAEAVFTEKRQSLEKIPGIGDSIITEIKRADVLLRAEKELAFAQKNGISIYFLKDMNYPERLRECPDAPVLFYFKGNADLNAAHIISVVGTRRASTYGQEVTERLLRDLSVIFPDLLVVSGLAYGNRYLRSSECVEEPIAHGGRIGAWFGSYLSSRASLYGGRDVGAGRFIDRLS